MTTYRAVICWTDENDNTDYVVDVELSKQKFGVRFFSLFHKPHAYGDVKPIFHRSKVYQLLIVTSVFE